jgi:hypothetical protein
MTNGRKLDREAVYEIRLVGSLNQTWSDWFDGFSITAEGGETCLKGLVADQAALMGLLMKINHLNLILLEVKWVGSLD